MVKINPTRRLSDREKAGVYNLWNQEYPANLRYTCMEDFDLYLSQLSNISSLLLTEDGEILGWAFKFEREKEMWFAMIIDAKLHGRGFGTALLQELKIEEEVLNGWVVEHNNYLKINGKRYQSPLGFYLKNKFKILPEKLLETAFLSAVQIQWKSEN